MSHPDLRARGAQRHPDLHVGATLLAFCGVAYWNTTTFGEVSPMLSQNVPPTFFPRLVLTIIAALSAALVVAGWTRTREPGRKVPPMVFVTGAAITALVALVPRLGMLATVCLAAIVLPVCWGERRVLPIALLAVALPLAIYLIFVLALDMRLPRGLLP